MKLKELVKFSMAVKKIADDALPLTCAYKIAKIEDVIAGDVDFYQKKYFEIVEKYGKRDDEGKLQYSTDGTVVMIDQEKINEAQEEITQLEEMNIELDIDKYLLDITDFDQTARMSIMELNSLMPFIK